MRMVYRRHYPSITYVCIMLTQEAASSVKQVARSSQMFLCVKDDTIWDSFDGSQIGVEKSCDTRRDKCIIYSVFISSAPTGCARNCCNTLKYILRKSEKVKPVKL